jgi:hypothetical protein
MLGHVFAVPPSTLLAFNVYKTKRRPALLPGTFLSIFCRLLFSNGDVLLAVEVPGEPR